MIIFIVLFGLYFICVMVNAVIQLKHDKKVEALAYGFWVNSLQKKGFPRNNSGAWMNAWELYEVWEKEDQEPYIKHAKKYKT